MNKYNAEHYRDETAAIAISRADRPRKAKKIYRTWPGLTYQIGEIVTLRFVGGRIRLWTSK